MQTRVWTSSHTDAEVDDNCRVAINEVEDTLNAKIGANSYGALKLWAYIAIILNPRFDLTPGEEVKKYRKKLQEFEFRLEINHATFIAADAVGQRKLIMASLLRSIDEMRKLVPKGIDYDRLEKDVRDVATAKGWLPDASHHAAAAEPRPAPPPPEDATLPAFKRLYKRIDGVLYYQSVGARDGLAFHHVGKVGTKGKTAELPYARQSPKQAVETFLAPAVAKGFTEMSEDHQIEIKYAISGFGETEDLNKLHALEEELDELLGSLELGFCDGNSIGSDTMEVCCFVVDADIAIKCIKKYLKGTRFADYATMHVVDRGEEDEVN